MLKDFLCAQQSRSLIVHIMLRRIPLRREMESVCRQREGVCFEIEREGVCAAIERGCVER